MGRAVFIKWWYLLAAFTFLARAQFLAHRRLISKASQGHECCAAIAQNRGVSSKPLRFSKPVVQAQVTENRCAEWKPLVFLLRGWRFGGGEQSPPFTKPLCFCYSPVSDLSSVCPRSLQMLAFSCLRGPGDPGARSPGSSLLLPVSCLYAARGLWDPGRFSHLAVAS